MNTLKLVGIWGVSALMLSCAWAARASVFDDAKFKLDIRGDANSNNYIDAGEVGNALDFSSASSITGSYGVAAGNFTITSAQYASGGYDKYGVLPRIEEMVVTNAINSAISSSEQCLRFFQDIKTDESNHKYCARYGVRFPNAAVQPNSDGRVTIYARFKWDGTTLSPNPIVGNGWNGVFNSDNGQTIYLDNEGKVGVIVHNNMSSSAGTAIKLAKNVWYDVFVCSRNETIGSATKAVSDISICTGGTVLNTSITNTQYMAWGSNAASKTVTLGCFLNNNTGWVNDPTKENAYAFNPRAFRGAVADVMIWDRELTDAEKLEVMTGSAPCGGDWQIGAVNSSADEFNDATPADVYDVQTMPWNKMRKSLTAENPSLALSTTMTADDHKRNRTLTFTPILSGTASAPVEVSLNGTVVGEIDLATTTSITLPRKLWRHGSGLANTIVVTRKAPVAGTVQFDAISLATGEYGEAGGVLEDATFKLDLRGGESTFTNPGDLGNALDYSAASPLVGYMGDQRGPRTYNANYGNLPAQETAAVTNPYYPYTTNTQDVLHFYQDQKSATASVRSSVVIPGAAPQGAVQTFYLRFRWDGETPATTYSPVYVMQSGNAANGWSEKGIAIYFDNITGRGTATTNAVVGYKASNDSDKFSNLSFTAGEWNDLFVTFAQNAENTKCTVTATLCKTPSKKDAAGFNPSTLSSQSVTVNKSIVFDTANLTLGGYHDSAGGANPTRAFRGLIADFMIWERALTDEEKIEIMAGQHGSKWTIGAANGSADEFTDTDPAAVYEPQTMPWRQMRKTLDASHPTLTLKSPLAEYEAGKPVILSVTPILDGTGAEVPVTVSVNGVAAGSLDLAKEHSLIIDRQHWTRDASGNVTVAITRTNTTESVAIDAITLSGSWQNAAEDGGSNGMVNEKYAPRFSFAGDTDVDHFTSSMSVGSESFSTNFTFGVWVPEGMGEKCGWKFRTATTSRSKPVDGLDAQHTVYVNGKAVGTHDGWFAANEPFTLEIPAGKLHDGMNYVQWVQTLPTRAAQQAVEGKPGVYQYYDFWGMTLVPPSKGLMIIIR